MKLYTRTGDSGQTGLIGGQRVSKADDRVACYGEVDELNAAIGLAAAACTDADALAELRTVQSELFILGVQLATGPGRQPSHQISDAEIKRLEESIDAKMGALPALQNFVLPGGCELAARLHLARTVCRRAERAVVDLAGTLDPRAAVYLNRLSDWLFAAALSANARAGVPDIPWIAR